MVETTTRATGGAVVDNEMSDGMQCSNHPYRNSSPGGICAFCLQEKLGKLVSSSLSSSFFIGSSSSTSPSFRSDVPVPVTATSTSTATASAAALRLTATCSKEKERRARIPFLLAQKKKKKALSNSTSTDMVLKRSKSAATPRSTTRYFQSDNNEDFTPRQRGFWSFLHLSNPKRPDRPKVSPGPPSSSINITEPMTESVVIDEADSSPNSSGGGSNAASFGRKVSRSRSVGCGSRSFSGDFFERISTGFGDCTLRRVESQREGRRSTSAVRDPIKERVRCGGLFGGFIITSSSSSSSSSSYWASVGDDHHATGRPTTTPSAGPLEHGRSRSWGRAFASPMRAFTKPAFTTTSTTIKDGNGNGGGGASKNKDLSAIPSLLTVRS